MKRSLLFMVISVLTVCGVGVAHGKACQGINFPEQVQVNVYVAALYVANISSDPQALLGSNTPRS